MSAKNEKPEWFQMTQGDEIPPRTRGRRVRGLAAVLPLLVLGGAFLLAQSPDGPLAAAASATTTEKTIITSVADTRSTGSVPSIKLPTGGEGSDDQLLTASAAKFLPGKEFD